MRHEGTPALLACEALLRMRDVPGVLSELFDGVNVRIPAVDDDDGRIVDVHSVGAERHFRRREVALPSGTVVVAWASAAVSNTGSDRLERPTANVTTTTTP